MSKKKTEQSPISIDEEFKIGDVIKRLREANRWSRRELARVAGISPAAIYKIENNQMIPTVTTVMKIARAFKKNIQDLLSLGADENYVVMRKGKRLRFNTPEFPMTAERISGDLTGRRLEAGIITVKKGASVSHKAMSHEGEEIHFVLKGEVMYNLGGEKIVLGEGDSIHFFSRVPHTWKNTGKAEARVLVVITPSPFV